MPGAKCAVYDCLVVVVVTFRVSRRRREMYICHACLCVCLSVCVCLCVCLCICLSIATCPHYCTDPDVSWGNGRRCPLVVHYWADLQSEHGFCCCDNIAPNAKCQRVLVLAVCLGPDSQTILGQTCDISYDNILWPIHRTLMAILRHKLS